MNKYKNGNIDGVEMIINIVFISTYILPAYWLRTLGLPLDQFLFAAILMVYYIHQLLIIKKIKAKDLVLLVVILYFCIVQKSLSHLNLMGMIVIDKILERDTKIKKYINKSKILWISLVFVIVYSGIYFGYDKRYLYTGLREINQSGYAILFLFLMIRAKYKGFGNVLIVCGFFTFSRNYLLGVGIWVLFKVFGRSLLFKNRLIQNKLKSFKFISICMIIIMIFISNYFSILYDKGLLNSYEEGWSRYLNVKDYSNYFRFVTNTNLIEIYKNSPEKLLCGIGTEEFLEYNRELSIIHSQPYRAIKPHNYYFSYFRIYGGFSIILFWYLSTLFNKMVTNNNLPIFLIIIAYISFLGIGLSSYWLFISVFTMVLYRGSNR